MSCFTDAAVKTQSVDSNLKTSKARQNYLLASAKIVNSTSEVTNLLAKLMQVLQGDEVFGETYLALGILSNKLKKDAIAQSFIERIKFNDEHYSEAQALLGNILRQNGDDKSALQHYENSLRRKSTNVDSLNGQALAFTRLGRYEIAIEKLNSVIELDTLNADAYYNRGVVHKINGNVNQAIDDYTRAIQIQKAHHQAYNNRGVAYREKGAFTLALSDFNCSASLQENFSESLFNKGMMLWMLGEHTKAWPLLEHRWETKQFTSKIRNFSQPTWLGDISIKGKKVLLHSEQGLGDTIQFCRFIKLVQKLDAEIFLEVEEPLINIMSCLVKPQNILAKGSKLPTFDFHCPLMSLPLALKINQRMDLENSPYLIAEHSRIICWKKRLQKLKKRRIGIAWKGNPNHSGDHLRSIQLDTLLKHLTKKFDWISLQPEVTADEAKKIATVSNFFHFGDLIGDFSETAALYSNLDAIISVDTSAAHLAGAIGVPVQLLLNSISDPRWHYYGTKTDWYPKTKIYRKTEHIGWDKVIERAISDLE